MIVFQGTKQVEVSVLQTLFNCLILDSDSHVDTSASLGLLITSKMNKHLACAYIVYDGCIDLAISPLEFEVVQTQSRNIVQDPYKQ